MGVSREEFLFYGVSKPYTGELSEMVEDIDQYSDSFETERFCALTDGMSGKYIIIGVLLARGDEYEGMELTEIRDKDIKWAKKEYLQNIGKYSIDTKPYIISVTHWS